ncbi:MAG TPA: tail fiber domain-containing protein, partial [Prolixibacteraceae bacterium]|nr:tail fiber domain-containing protein [Prolixibacteraceae bacterium]
MEVNSDGDCEFNYDVSINGAINGTLVCNNNVSIGGILNCSYMINGLLELDNEYGPMIMPSTNNYGSIGSSSHNFHDVYCYDLHEVSDTRQKENVRDLNNPLNTIKQLKGIKYDIKKEFAYDVSVIRNEKVIEKLEKDRLNNLGFLAQDVYEVLPEVVHYDDSTDRYSINYTRIIPVLVEAIKELSAEVDQLKSSNNLKSASLNPSEITREEIPELSQNVPNPFNANTTIRMYLPETIARAVLYIYTLQGEQIKQ